MADPASRRSRTTTPQRSGTRSGTGQSPGQSEQDAIPVPSRSRSRGERSVQAISSGSSGDASTTQAQPEAIEITSGESSESSGDEDGAGETLDIIRSSRNLDSSQRHQLGAEATAEAMAAMREQGTPYDPIALPEDEPRDALSRREPSLSPPPTLRRHRTPTEKEKQNPFGGLTLSENALVQVGRQFAQGTSQKQRVNESEKAWRQANRDYHFRVWKWEARKHDFSPAERGDDPTTAERKQHQKLWAVEQKKKEIQALLKKHVMNKAGQEADLKNWTAEKKRMYKHPRTPLPERFGLPSMKARHSKAHNAMEDAEMMKNDTRYSKKKTKAYFDATTKWYEARMEKDGPPPGGRAPRFTTPVTPGSPSTPEYSVATWVREQQEGGTNRPPTDEAAQQRTADEAPEAEDEAVRQGTTREVQGPEDGPDEAPQVGIAEGAPDPDPSNSSSSSGSGASPGPKDKPGPADDDNASHAPPPQSPKPLTQGRLAEMDAVGLQNKLAERIFPRIPRCGSISSISSMTSFDQDDDDDPHQPNPPFDELDEMYILRDPLPSSPAPRQPKWVEDMLEAKRKELFKQYGNGPMPPAVRPADPNGVLDMVRQRVQERRARGTMENLLPIAPTGLQVQYAQQGRLLDVEVEQAKVLSSSVTHRRLITTTDLVEGNNEGEERRSNPSLRRSKRKAAESHANDPPPKAQRRHG